ncbi:hypothetical protein CesoFtcFv8_002052 [Champsocephalus esox]|uniref:Uncharacterized protein n=1 Tax=Champsocephalus esox TaxID=159716 RepID=A0AAN8CYA2_9TELE|nr:hypothetical protein CesoFtcFv8_002052 [Champsocephalus esox]
MMGTAFGSRGHSCRGRLRSMGRTNSVQPGGEVSFQLGRDGVVNSCEEAAGVALWCGGDMPRVGGGTG